MSISQVCDSEYTPVVVLQLVLGGAPSGVWPEPSALLLRLPVLRWPPLRRREFLVRVRSHAWLSLQGNEPPEALILVPQAVESEGLNIFWNQ